MCCIWIRSFMFLTRCYDTWWRSRNYVIEFKKIYNPNYRKNKFGRYDRHGGGSTHSGTSHGSPSNNGDTTVTLTAPSYGSNKNRNNNNRGKNGQGNNGAQS